MKPLKRGYIAVKTPDFGAFRTFTDAQLITATSTFSAAAARVRNETLDEDFPDRLAHAVMLLGSRSIISNYGGNLEPMTVNRFKDSIGTEFEVTSQSVDNDLTKLKEEGIISIEKGVLSDGRQAVVSLTEVGEILYRLLGERIACLILSIAELLVSEGAVPADPRAHIKDSIKDYGVRVRRELSRSQKKAD